jgi:hypothetical protein
MNEREASGDDANWSALRQLFAMKAGRLLSARGAGNAAGVSKNRFYEWRRGVRVPSDQEFATIRAFLNSDLTQMATADDRAVFERFLTVTLHHSPAAAGWTIHVSNGVIRRWRSERDNNLDFLPSRDKCATIRTFLSNPLAIDVVVEAVRSGTTHRVKHVMQSGVVYDIDALDAQGEVAIVRAAADGHDVIVGYLTTCGADPNVQDRSDATPLYKAAENGHADAVYRLLNPVYGERATVDLARPDGRVALHAACENNHVECVRLLHEAGANHDVRSAGRGGATPLEIALRRGDDDECALILLGRARSDSIIVLSDDESSASESDSTEASSPSAIVKRRRTKAPPKREQDDDNDDDDVEEEEEDDEKEKEEAAEAAESVATAALRRQQRQQQQQQEQVQIRYETLENFRPLGEGGFGTVQLAHWSSGPYDVAVKSLLLAGTGNRDSMRAMFRHEAELHSRLRHDRILSLYGVVFHNDEVHIVMPLVARSLYDAIYGDGANSERDAKRERPPFVWPTRARICSEIASGLHYLHTLPTEVLHRDLKSPNVLLDQYNSAKLADFGLARVSVAPGAVVPPFISNASLPRTPVGSAHWQAPELHLLVPEYSTASDIFALGMVAWELASWTLPPFVTEHERDTDAIKRSVENGERPQMPADAPPMFAEVVRQCWAQRASERPSAREAFDKFGARTRASVQ